MFNKILIAKTLSLLAIISLILPVKTNAIGMLSQPIEIKDALRGQKIPDKLNILNSAAQQVEYDLGVSGDIVGWVTFYQESIANPITSVLMPANSWKEVNLLITVPGDLPNGEYAGALAVIFDPSKSESIADTTSATVKQQITREVFISITDQEIIKLEASVTPDKYILDSAEELRITARYYNNGNIILKPDLGVSILDPQGKQIFNAVFPYPADQEPVKPRGRQTITIPYQTTGLADGKYQARTAVKLTGQADQTDDFTFVIGDPQVAGAQNSVLNVDPLIIYALIVLLIGVNAFFLAKIIRAKKMARKRPTSRNGQKKNGQKNHHKKLAGLVLAMLALSGLLISDMANANGSAQMCTSPVDVVLVLDRSGSMEDGAGPATCDWYQREMVGPSMQFVSCAYPAVPGQHANCVIPPLPLTKVWCEAQIEPAHLPTFLPASNSKIVEAKSAANEFVSLLGTSDQSALVSFSTTARLDKGLSTNHPATTVAINAVTVGGATDIGDAISFAAAEFSSPGANPQAAKTIILLTDGRANKPYGNGYDENPLDINYALQKAAAAANQGIIIFTIGLGADVNSGMLQDIANATGGQYHFAPNGAYLHDIYNSIAQHTCHYGSLAGCKYVDSNNDGSLTNEQTLAGWKITLNGNYNITQQTDASGCFKFSGLLPDSYSINENANTGTYIRTYPSSSSYSVSITEGENRTGLNFGNYFPQCGNSILDTSYGEVCELGATQSCTAANNYQGQKNCASDCQSWGSCVATEVCGDAIKNGNEECDGTSGLTAHHTCTAACTLEYVPYCGDSLINQSSEACDGDAPQACVTNGYSGTESCTSCQWSACVASQSCGDAIKNGSEECDGSDGLTAHHTCTASCTLEYVPYCGDSLINQSSEACDGDAPQACVTNGYSGSKSCDSCAWASCASTLSCGDGIKNGNEQCDGTDGLTAHHTCTASCALEYVPYCGDNLTNQQSEQCDGDTPRACTTPGGYSGNQSCATCLWGICQTTASCGDNTKNGTETCDDGSKNGTAGFCNADCTGTTPSGDNGGSGGTTLPGSIKVCVYADSDASLATTADQTLSADWSITINQITQKTATTGCTIFDNLAPGNYAAYETLPTGWQTLDPATSHKTATVTSGQQALINFINFYQSSGGGGGGSYGGDNGPGSIFVPVGGNTGSGTTDETTPPPVVKGEQGSPRLTLSKIIETPSGVDFANPGDKLTYILGITNSGNLTAFGVTVADTLPAGFTDIDTGSATHTWNIGDLAPGASQELRYQVLVNPTTAGGTYKNTATVQAANHDPVIASADVEIKSVIVKSAELLPETGFKWSQLLLLAMMALSSFVIALRLRRKYA